MMAAAGAAAFAGVMPAQGANGLRLTPGGGSITQVSGLRVGHYTCLLYTSPSPRD